jgi:hypothetical protein
LPHDTAIARIKPNGALDPNFKGDGTLRINLGGDDEVNDAYLDARGRLVVAGGTAPASRWSLASAWADRVAL